MGPRVRGDDIRVFVRFDECSNTVIASQRVGAKRRPMTGSAKQSMARHNGKLDCFVAYAPRNDEKQLPDRLRRLSAAVAGRLIGDPRVMRAIGQAVQRLAAAEEEFRTRGIADRPVAGGFI